MPDGETTSEEIQVLIFSIANEEFGARTSQIQEIIRMTEITRMPKAPSFIKGTINLRGKVVAVIDLAKQFDLPKSEQDDEARIIVADVDNNIVGMIVDSASEVLRIPTENIDPTPAFIESRIDTRYFEGIGKLVDRLFVPLDLAKLLSPDEMKNVEEATAG